MGIGPPVNLNLDDDNDDSDKEEDDADKGGPLEDVPDCACTPVARSKFYGAFATPADAGLAARPSQDGSVIAEK